MKLEYVVVVPSELGAGLRGFTDEVSIEFKDGAPDWETERECREHFRQSIAEWYDGGRVWVKADYEEYQSVIDKQIDEATPMTLENWELINKQVQP